MLKGIIWTPRPLQGLLLTATPRVTSRQKANALLRRHPLTNDFTLLPAYRFKALLKWGLAFYYAPTDALAWHIAAHLFMDAAVLAGVPLKLSAARPSESSQSTGPLRLTAPRRPSVFAFEMSIGSPKRFTLGWWAAATADLGCYASLRQHKLYRFSPRLLPLAGLSVRLFL